MGNEAAATQQPAQPSAAAAREAEEARANETRRNSGIWDFLKGLIPKFDFFGILTFLAVACGAYFLGRTREGQDFLGGIFGPEKVRDFFSRADGMLGGMAGSLGLNIDISQTLAGMSIEDVRKKLEEQKLSPAAIALIAKDKPTFDAFVGVIKAANQTTHAGKLYLNDLKPETIIKGPALDALLTPENRASTVALMVAAAPANAGITTASLNAIISNGVGQTDGKPTTQLRTLLTAAVDGRLTALQASMNGADGKFSRSKAVEALLNGETRTLIRSMGTDSIAIALRAQAPTLSKEMLDAALAFGDAIDANPANGGVNRPRTLSVLKAVASIGEGTPATTPKMALSNISADQLSGFFTIPGNQTAVSNLLKVVQPSMASFWGNANEGLAEVLASKPDAQKILSFVRGEDRVLVNVAAAGSGIATAMGVSPIAQYQTALGLMGNKLAENAQVMAPVMAMLAPATPATPARTQARPAGR